jgi:hypothetical protein
LINALEASEIKGWILICGNEVVRLSGVLGRLMIALNFIAAIEWLRLMEKRLSSELGFSQPTWSVVTGRTRPKADDRWNATD